MTLPRERLTADPGVDSIVGDVLELPRRAPGRVFNMATPLVDRHVAEGHGSRPALHLDDRTVSYAELQALQNRAGNTLRRAGIQSEQRVAILLRDGPEFVATFLGAMKIGAVPLPLNTLAHADELQHLLADSRTRALVAAADLAGPVLAHSSHLQLTTALIVGGVLEHPLARSFAVALSEASAELEPFPTGVDEPCYWLYSSGTTGRPKGVVHLHGDMLACVAPYAEEVVAITPDDSTFSVARLFFSYGLVNSLFLPLLAGASAVLTPERPDAAHVLRVVARHRPTLVFSVPTSYAQLCAAVEGSTASAFASVRLAVSAGEPLPAPLYARWRRLTGIELLDGLGSTEVGYIFCSNLPGRVRPGSSGVLIGDHAARIVDEQGREVPDGEAGELWVRAESTALHYWNQRARSKAVFVGEWLRTGDRYRRDADGFYWYLGRTDDLFKVSGQWVSPLELESCLLSHPGVLECAVVGAQDEAGLLKPKAYVVPRPGTRVEAAELQALAKAQLLPHMYPRWVELVPELPKTATGKVQRYRLRTA
jgi:benzoate-CoA ligase